ncbi:HAD family hydrolase [Loktanella sp. D2R18]|uniref:HAD-IA family hydrolase n=1 Tax=Rhodobacterales TaxID=204455 RepID=UPI000DE9ECE0|nr:MULTISPECIES: HAD-IA family hydrolase [Rhodobacterales]MDO6589901.1 HAD-IA family hydrolase [Yoonia sp. 1_MG-2023]RBW45950.1 HAD family hydrolase [Loktanella sp. D2R18]
MPDLRLVIFDVDGTLVDSQDEILTAMTHAFDAEGRTMPARADVLSIVGLSLDVAFAKLCPDTDGATQDRLVAGYKDAFSTQRAQNANHGPLYPGARDVLDALAAQANTLLAVATGKSRRGLDKLLERHALEGFFHSEQVADHHPSKPNPSMILTALNELGVAQNRAVMVGDTTYDMDMARAAGVAKIGVPWGYHAADALRPDMLITDFGALPAAVDTLVGR